MQWIPFENFNDVKFVSEGGYSSVFSATWVNKKDQVWDGAKQTFVEKPLMVALKSLKNSQNLSDEFLDEVCNFTATIYSNDLRNFFLSNLIC
jgi:hypothetical protein